MNINKPAIDLSEPAISVSDLLNLIKIEKNLIVLDVRTKEERDSVHIENSAWIPLSELPLRLSELNTNHSIVVYCRTDGRSRQATQFLRDAQFKSVKYLIGGITAWQNQL